MRNPSQSVDTASANKHLIEANEALAKDDAVAALESLRHAIEADPYSEELPLLAATIQLRQGDPIHAAHLAMDALSIRPYYPQALDVLGVSYIEALQPETAEKILRYAARLAPGSKNIISNLRDARKQKKEIKRAGIPKKELLRATAILPEKRVREFLTRSTPRLSTLIIAIDETAEQLAASVASVEVHSDEVIIVDAREASSGTDAFKSNAKVNVIPFDHDHIQPTAHNSGLRRASGDWVLVLQAGDVLRTTPNSEWQDRLIVDEAVAYVVDIQSTAGGDRRSVRLVRNAGGLQFRGRHESTLDTSLAALETRWNLHIFESAIEIETGCIHVLDLTQPRPSDVNNLVKQDLLADVADPQARLDQAESLIAENKPEKALEILRALKQERSHDERHARRLDLEYPTTLYLYALYQMKRHDELCTMAREYHDSFPATANTRYIEALSTIESGDRQRGIELLTDALDLRDAPGYGPLLIEVQEGELPTRLGLLLLETGDGAQAIEAFDTALQYNPGYIDARLGRCTAEMSGGQVDSALKELDQLIQDHATERKVWIAGDILLRQVPALAPTTVELLSEALQHLPEDSEIQLRLAEAQLRCGRADDARACWEKSPTLTPRLSTQVAAAIAADKSLPTIEASDRAMLVDEVIHWYQTWLSTGAIDALDRALVRTPRLVDELPGLATQAADWLERCGQPEAAQQLRC